MRYNHYGINCDYAQRREFHRPFWEALRAQFSRLFLTDTQTHAPHKVGS